MSQGPAYLIDASVYVFRAYHSIPGTFVSDDGEPVHAVYGFAGFLLGLLERSLPRSVVLAFDESLTTSFRNELYPAYKANREQPPPELERQFVFCRQLGEALGLTCLADRRFEADDIIGTLTKRYQSEERPVVIVSSDKDLAQLLGPSDRLWDLAQEKVYDERGIGERFGVAPGQVADYLALIGDAVDNIPGVPGIGPKTAVALLGHFGSLEALTERLDEVPYLRLRGAKGVHRRLVEHRDALALARRLTEIRDDVPRLPATPALAWQEPDMERLETLFDDWRFGTRLRERCRRLAETHAREVPAA